MSRKKINWSVHGDLIVSMYVDQQLSVRQIVAEIDRLHGTSYPSGTLTNYLGRRGVLRSKSEAHALIHKKRTKLCESCGNKYNARSYRQRWCHECTGITKYKKRMHAYGVGAPALDAMLQEQDFACKICLEKFPEGFSTDRRKTLYVDHDHATGRVRGLVCPRCNLGLSYLDRPGWLQKAQLYLEQAKSMPDQKTLNHRAWSKNVA